MHGGDIYFTEEKLLDVSANINPFGIPESVMTAIRDALPEIVHYPDREQRKLRKAIADYHKIPEDWIICGNGGADVLFRTVQTIRPGHALIPVPTFTEYEKALQENSCHVTHWKMEMPDFSITEKLLPELEKNNYDFLVLCNPNNPTGLCIERDLLLEILKICRERHIFVLLDECFFDMTDLHAEEFSMIREIQDFPNLFILKSLTKLYAIPGLRSGYGICSDPELIRSIRATGQPWSVNTLASAAGCAILEQGESYRISFLEFLEQERNFLAGELKQFNFNVWDSRANYLFFQAKQYPDLDQKLLTDKILIRHCDSYPVLDKSYYRIAVRTHEENLYLLNALKKLKHAKSIMIMGTMSSAGKSFVTAGLCRIFHQDGYKTAPFKSQNMALNSYITQDGSEMGRAQVMQAEAAGILPDVRMNPILLKPTSEKGSQIIVNGKVFDSMTAKEYYQHKQEFVPVIQDAYESLAQEYDVIVLEGAGSPAEINLKQVDIVNMGMAEISDSPVILVGDIDRGGVFASLYGTIALLDAHEKSRIKGMVINKFRGDPEILEPGLKMLEELTGIPVLGVLPYTELDLDDEDSLSERLSKHTIRQNAVLDIAVIKFPRISNFTDFKILESLEHISVRYVSGLQELQNPDLILLPGTKNTISDLLWMRQNGLEAGILKAHEKGTVLFGICGGYQMLGKNLSDPEQIEQGGTVRGMGLCN
ncbi:MAG: cobyric acid synthase, partial [Oscillospiraceae bacterium]|nr:cobyric acid synthase [Oscillospiraceae bacterium]